MTCQHYTEKRKPQRYDRVYLTGGSRRGFVGTITRQTSGWWVVLDEWPDEEFKVYTHQIARAFGTICPGYRILPGEPD